MEEKRPFILISNDDGYTSKGIHELIDFLLPIADLLVVAPDTPRSGSGCAISVHTPIHYELVSRSVGLDVYKCSGTPTDCIKIALNTLCGKRQPDLIVGGINHGDNSSVNVHYSGTMGVVIEGCLRGIPSVAFSLCNHAADADFSPMRPYVVQVTQLVLAKGLPHQVCLNVNFPNTPDYKGIRICRQAGGYWDKEAQPIPHRDDPNYYWLVGEFVDTEPDNPQSDHWALHNGYVAITPTTVDVTAYSFMEELNTWF